MNIEMVCDSLCHLKFTDMPDTARAAGIAGIETSEL